MICSIRTNWLSSGKETFETRRTEIDIIHSFFLWVIFIVDEKLILTTLVFISDCAGVGVKPEEIIADPWSLRYSPSYVESRVTKLLADNVPVKCWLVRASSEARNRFVSPHVDY